MLMNWEPIFEFFGGVIYYTDIQFYLCVLIWGIYFNKLGENEVEFDISILTWHKQGMPYVSNFFLHITIQKNGNCTGMISKHVWIALGLSIFVSYS